MKCGAGIGLGLWVGALTAALFLPARTTVAADPDGDIIRIGLVNSLFRDKPIGLLKLATRPLKDLMEAQLGVKSELVFGSESDALGRRLNDGEVQLGVFHGFEFAWVRQKYPNLKPLIIAVNEDPVLHAHLVVRADSKAKTYADLKGQTIALPRGGCEHCRLFLEKRCTDAGVPANKFYAKVKASRECDDALNDVFDGDIQAAIVDGIALESYRKRKPNRSEQLRTLQESEPFPCAVVAYCPGVITEDQVTRFRAGMVVAHQNEQGRQVLKLAKITSFNEVPDGYEQLLVNVLKAYPAENVAIVPMPR